MPFCLGNVGVFGLLHSALEIFFVSLKHKGLTLKSFHQHNCVVFS